MKITELRLKRLINCGDYENATLEITVKIEDDEDPQEAFDKAKRFIDCNVALMYPENRRQDQ